LSGQLFNRKTHIGVKPKGDPITSINKK